MSDPDAVSQAWSRRAKLVKVRFVLVGGAVLTWGALVWLTVSVQAGTTTAVSSGIGRPTVVTQSTTTLYQESPGAVGLILAVLAAAVVTATASVIWRVVHHSERIGITGMVVAVLVGGMALLGMLTIGMFIVPLAVLLVLLAIPIAPERTPMLLGAPAPGWYSDPSGRASLRYWDGRAWTVQTARTPAP